MSEQATELLNQATTALQQGQFEASLQYADQALAADPSNGNAYLIRAIALSRTGQPDLATAAFRSAIDVMPSSSSAHYNLAVHYHAQGMKRESLDSARTAVELDANNGQARDLVNLLNAELGGGEVRPPEAATPPAMAQNPYMSQAAGDYYRPAYQGGPQGAVSYVNNMGDRWNTFGLILLLVGAGIWIFAIANTVMKWDEIMEAARTGRQAPSTPLELAMNVISIVNSLLSLFWVASDISNRRGNWMWLVGFIICCCCTPFQAVYYLVGRK